MARRRSYMSTFAQMQREAARAQAAQVRAQTAARKEAERARTAYLRTQVADEKERKRLYAESRAAEVAAKNDDLEAEIAALQGLLAATFKVNDRISFSSLKKPAAVPPWRHPGAWRSLSLPLYPMLSGQHRRPVCRRCSESASMSRPLKRAGCDTKGQFKSI